MANNICNVLQQVQGKSKTIAQQGGCLCHRAPHDVQAGRRRDKPEREETVRQEPERVPKVLQRHLRQWSARRGYQLAQRQEQELISIFSFHNIIHPGQVLLFAIDWGVFFLSH